MGHVLGYRGNLGHKQGRKCYPNTVEAQLSSNKYLHPRPPPRDTPPSATSPRSPHACPTLLLRQKNGKELVWGRLSYSMCISLAENDNFPHPFPSFFPSSFSFFPSPLINVTTPTPKTILFCLWNGIRIHNNHGRASAKCRASARRGKGHCWRWQLDDLHMHMMDEAAMPQTAHFDSLMCGSGYRLSGRRTAVISCSGVT